MTVTRAGARRHWPTSTHATVDQAEAIVAPAMASGPLDVTIVGDVTVDQAIAAVAPTFGALPRRTVAGPPPNGRRTLSKADDGAGAPDRHGRAPIRRSPRSPGRRTDFFPTCRSRERLRVLAEIFCQRLLDELRTREGITYTPGASTYSSLVTPDYGFIYALAQIPPDKIDTFYDVVAHVADDLKNKPIAADELERARGPRIEDIQRQQQTNEYWLSLLAGAQADPRRLDVIRTTIPDLQGDYGRRPAKGRQTWLIAEKGVQGRRRAGGICRRGSAVNNTTNSCIKNVSLKRCGIMDLRFDAPTVANLRSCGMQGVALCGYAATVEAVPGHSVPGW